MVRRSELVLEDVKVTQLRDNCFRLRFVTSRRTNQGVLHHREGNTASTVMVGGAGGGYNGPASIYRDIAPHLLDYGISSLRLDFRWPNKLEEWVMDVLLGIEFLKSLEVDRVGLVGWSFGGAVVINAGVASDIVNSVVTIASQTYGTGVVDELTPKALLLIHGTADETLPFACSQDLYARAGDPKELVLYEGGNHGVDQKRKEMLAKVESFLIEHLGVEEEVIKNWPPQNAGASYHFQ